VTCFSSGTARVRESMFLCVCVSVCLFLCLCLCVCVCVSVCASVSVSVVASQLVDVTQSSVIFQDFFSRFLFNF
jgi:hypothetical protein